MNPLIQTQKGKELFLHLAVYRFFKLYINACDEVRQKLLIFFCL